MCAQIKGTSVRMNTLNEETVHALLRRARRDAGVTQSALADELGCRQSAISMFESGHLHALAWEKVEHFAARFDVDISQWDQAAPTHATRSRLHLAYCPAADCPSNVPYSVGDTTCLKPRLVTTHDSGPAYCRLCGEVLESRCANPDCRGAVHEGAFCPFCGDAYVSPQPGRHRTSTWITRQREAITELYALTRTGNPLPSPPSAAPASPRPHRNPARMERSS